MAWNCPLTLCQACEYHRAVSSLTELMATISTTFTAAGATTPLRLPAALLIIFSSPKPPPGAAVLAELLDVVLLAAVDMMDELVVARRSRAGTLNEVEACAENARRAPDADDEDALRFRLMRSTTAGPVRRGFGS